MRRKNVSVLALAIATSLPGRTLGAEDFPDKPESELPAGSVASIAPAALVAAGLAAIAAIAGGGGRGGGGGGGAGSGSTATGAGNTPSRSLYYTSPLDFRTSEYNAQQGLGMVKADSLYYNGHYRWYTGDASDPAAGTGIGVKIAVADTGINPREGSTGNSIAIDVASSYDYVNNRPGATADDDGHGTHVAGLIAAPKNGAGMHGLAYNASLVSFKVANANGIVTASDAQLGDMINRAGNAGAMIINNSWYTATSITATSAENLQASMPRMIEAARAYVAKGGVVVFAAGNEAAPQPALQPGLPYRITGIEPGWLAVVAIDNSGKLAAYSNRCGVAAAWCLAAPGGSSDSGLYSMYNNGGYASMYGTSMAAPHASAAIAALKSMFVNLSYLQIRDRLLYTANRSGTYADASSYGQGLIDLEAASSPVGGVAVPTSASATGPAAPVTTSAIVFPAGAVGAIRMQPWVLVVDNYQRAPFWVAAQTFFREATPRLIDRQWASLTSTSLSGTTEKLGSRMRFSHSPGLNDVMSVDLGTYRLGFSQGAGGEAILGSHLQLASVPRLAAPGVDSVALGYASDVGALRIGFLGTLPTTKETIAQTIESSSLGSRRALGLVAQHRAVATTYGISLAAASQFERPIGMATSGAFGVGDSAALSSGIFVQQSVGATSMLEGSLEIARHRTEANLALTAPGYALRSANFGVHTALGLKTTISASLKREWTGGEKAQLQVPLTIAENGDIGRVSYALPYDDLVGRTAFTLRLDHELTRQASLRASLTRERYGFGASITGIAAVLEITN